MKIRYRFLSEKGAVLFSNLDNEEMCVVDQVSKRSELLEFGGTKKRCGMLKLPLGTVIGFTDDINYLKSTKLFISAMESLAKTFESFQEIINAFQDKANVNANRLIHNLIALNAHNIQEIYSVVSQDVLSSSSANNQLSLVENVIKKDPRETASAILRIAKNNAAMKAEFSVFKKLFDTNPQLEKKSHNVHKVLMNVLYLFFPDFTDKNVEIKVSCPPNTMAYFDYESIHVSFYHLIENAVKYVRTSSQLFIDIFELNNAVKMSFSMISLLINQQEKEAIFEEGFSGEIARKLGKAGTGIGMTMVKKILEINDASISLETDTSTLEEKIGIPYQKNIFAIILRAKK